MSTITGRLTASPRPRQRRIRLSPRTRKVMLVTHIASAGAWLGLDLVLGILVFSAFTADALPAAAAAASIASFTTWPLITIGLLTLATGVVLGLGSKYGLARYWWVLVKLALNIVLVIVAIVSLAPSTQELAGAAFDDLAIGTAPQPSPTLIFPPIVSSTAVLVAITLSVFRPWGQVRVRRGTGRGTGGPTGFVDSSQAGERSVATMAAVTGQREEARR